ncbi:uncharacterized protein G6M90_00g001350 [Metarhizium brunneum]|uniref:EKC/KEOPS complex subunit BUD32 n=1 Tax=Metarhizium brunneum TaxID=500148 RepID=A0A7D5Z129_9HYPO
MIEPQQRLWVGSGSLVPGAYGPFTWFITDFDQRRHFSITYAPKVPVENREETEDICIAELKKHLDNLGDGVFGFRFSEPDGPITTSTDLKDDATIYVNDPALSSLGLSFPVKTIYLGSLTELDRLAPLVDKVLYHDTHGATTTAAFKYWFMANGMSRVWYELNDWCRLPRDHPHIVPFDSVVLSDVTGRIVGFTSRFVSGGTLHENNATTRPFRLGWFRQLLSVVDGLNYKYGVMHQDIAARNLIINEDDNLQIFDFNYAISIAEYYTPERDDVKGVIFTLYEIITLDEHFRDVPHKDQDAEALLQMEWSKHPDVKLDSNIQAFRDVLNDWVSRRKQRRFEPRDTWLSWPHLSEWPLAPRALYGPDGEVTGKEMRPTAALSRRELVSMGEAFWNWERPASYRLAGALSRGDSDGNLSDGAETKASGIGCASVDTCAVP